MADERSIVIIIPPQPPRRRRGAHKLSTIERGYGREHKQMREKVKRIVNAGRATCSRCGGWIPPGSAWDLDHHPNRLGWLGPSHRSCNAAAPRRRRQPNMQPKRKPRARALAFFD